MAKRGLFMTKKDMAKAIADEMGLTHSQATEVIQHVLDGITETLCEDGRARRVRLRSPRQDSVSLQPA
jgi:nucleoid DNA-binding protein